MKSAFQMLRIILHYPFLTLSSDFEILCHIEWIWGDYFSLGTPEDSSLIQSPGAGPHVTTAFIRLKIDLTSSLQEGFCYIHAFYYNKPSFGNFFDFLSFVLTSRCNLIQRNDDFLNYSDVLFTGRGTWCCLHSVTVSYKVSWSVTSMSSCSL